MPQPIRNKVQGPDVIGGKRLTGILFHTRASAPLLGLSLGNLQVVQFPEPFHLTWTTRISSLFYLPPGVVLLKLMPISKAAVLVVNINASFCKDSSRICLQKSSAPR
jgi:hypothetical protein